MPRVPVSSRRVTPPPTFVLIAGAWHGAWCWHRLTPLLERHGSRVIAPDLPSMSGDPSPADQVTLDSWARFVADIVERQPEPVVLVGHSRGGIVVSQAAELVPGRIRHLVYLSAYLLPAGATLAAEARRDAESLIAPNMIAARSGITCNLRESAVREAFYGLCSEADYEHARLRLSPEPLKPLVTPLTLTADRFGSVPRAYVETTRDRTVTLASQRRMQAQLPCAPVFTLESDHSPFLSQPEVLARILISI
jgi:pimeloyl-ACP methyl ester carboxylesterase